MDTLPPRRPTVAQVLLGGFIIWQVIFLVVANVVVLFPHGQPDEGEVTDLRRTPETPGSGGLAQTVVNGVADLTDEWTFLTGQVQAWWLFAPDFPTQSAFPTVELRWDGSSESRPPVRLYSVLEPENPQSYFRPPGSRDRQFHYEMRLGLIPVVWDEELIARYPDIWRQSLQTHVRRQCKSMCAYLDWRVEQYRHEHPDVPAPTEVILLFRVYVTPNSDQQQIAWHGPIEQPVARWQRCMVPSPRYLPLQWYDPAVRQFVDLPQHAEPTLISSKGSSHE
jgi:hypothetical protein